MKVVENLKLAFKKIDITSFPNLDKKDIYK